MTYDVIAVVKPGIVPSDAKMYYYNFGPVKTTGSAKNLCKRMAKKYYDTFCKVHEFGSLLIGAMDTVTGENVDGVKVSMNIFDSRCMYVGFEPETLPECREYTR